MQAFVSNFFHWQMFLRLIHVAVCISSSFLLLGSISMHGYIPLCLSIHQFIDIWIVPFLGYYE